MEMELKELGTELTASVGIWRVSPTGACGCGCGCGSQPPFLILYMLDPRSDSRARLAAKRLVASTRWLAKTVGISPDQMNLSRVLSCSAQRTDRVLILSYHRRLRLVARLSVPDAMITNTMTV